jgi:hypothetical protein
VRKIFFEVASLKIKYQKESTRKIFTAKDGACRVKIAMIAVAANTIFRNDSKLS